MRPKRKRRVKEEDEKVIFEGELLKLSAGVSKNTAISQSANQNHQANSQYIPRWVQLTENKFRYFKSQIQAYQQPGKPLLSIPIEEIVHIIKTKASKNEIYIEFIMENQLTQYILKNNLIEKVYSTQKKQESPTRINKNYSPDREVIPGHLMRLPLQSRNSTLQSGGFQTTVQNKVQNIQSNFSHHIHEEFFQASKKKRKIGGVYQTLMEETEPIETNQWTQREFNWFALEEVLLFKNNKDNIQFGDFDFINKLIKKIDKQKQKLLQRDVQSQVITKEQNDNTNQKHKQHKIIRNEISKFEDQQHFTFSDSKRYH
ncbi:UNKNOWN [Stylonychia lemnae]|uniref:Uncharacterized protein n=1 Tax=Stylonychia lemnae TaxID=5949 RepID=A0A078A5J6_STYLE|nr:UNKNOWN [Stylonychia lemnae]|eukprot:CDW77510.1 UNKNOWN [Stylonychia lemnae]